MPYRCEAASIEGFVQQLACNLVNKGYWYYVTGNIPPHKDPLLVDRKLIIRYGLDISKWTRARRKANGHANVAYLRYHRFFVLLATQGAHLLFEEEGGVKDIRREHIRFHGYSIGSGKGSDGRSHASVRIDPDTFSKVRAYLLNLAVHRSPEYLEQYFERDLEFMPYARIRRQILRLVREVNEIRRTAGYKAVMAPNPRRVIVRPFVERSNAEERLVGIVGANESDDSSQCTPGREEDHDSGRSV